MASVNSLIKRFEALSESIAEQPKLRSKPPETDLQRNPLEPTSDGNCEKQCGLQYGVSNLFNGYLNTQLQNKSSQTLIQPYIFDDPNDQKSYSHMLKDEMVNRFDGEGEKNIFRKSLEGMKLHYPEILDGKEKNMFYCPTSFHFSSRIKEDETSVPDRLDEMKISMESQQPLTLKDHKHLKKIRDHLEKLRPELAEQEFVDALACFFYNHRGIFVHSLKLDDHLKILRKKARDHRQQNKSMSFAMTDFEKKLAKQLNISRQSLVNAADSVESHLLAKHKANDMTSINGRVIRESIDDREVNLSTKDKMNIKKLFKPANNYTIDEVRDGIMLGKFESECRFAGENDLIIMLPDSKLFLCVEIKRHMKPEGEKSGWNHMESASKQLKKNAWFIASKHGAILSSEWRFVKVCAISPSIYNQEKICSHCKKFILTTDIVKTPGKLEEWWRETGLSERAAMFDKMSKENSYSEFQLFFNRLVCMSSVRVVSDPFRSWAQVHGNRQHHMGAGHTQAERDVRKRAELNDLEFGEVLKEVHHAYKTLFFTKDQMAILTTDQFPSAIFLCDFGGGNQLRMSMRNNKKANC